MLRRRLRPSLAVRWQAHLNHMNIAPKHRPLKPVKTSLNGGSSDLVEEEPNKAVSWQGWREFELTVDVGGDDEPRRGESD